MFFLNVYIKWKYENNFKIRRNDMYRKLGVKKVVFLLGEVEWYGCGKNIGRCFGIVFDDMFEYFYMLRWILFCCLENLR